MYIVNQEQVENIYNQLNHFECYSFEGSTIIDPSLDIGDIVTIDNKKVIYQGDMEYVGKFKVSICSKIQAKSKEETTRTIVSDKSKIRRVQSEINQLDGRITQLVQETGEYDEKISKVEQDIDSINQKVSNVADFTRTVEGKNEIHLTETIDGKGYILDFTIKGNTDNFVYLPPHDGLTPSNTLVPLGGYFTIISDKQNRAHLSDEAEIVRIILDEPLRNLGDICDEFKIIKGQATVIRRIGLNDDLSLYVLENEVIDELGELELKTFEGDTYIYVQEYYNLVCSAKYVIDSEYSDVYATKVEMNTNISQTAEKISLEVNKKVDESELGTKIEQNAEAVKIAWNQISEFIQLMILNNNASFAILDKDKKVLMSLDKEGQHFYKDGKDIFGEMGVQNINDERFISFSVEGDYDKQIENGMAWGIKTKSDGKFYPILSIRNFAMGPQNSDASYGELELSSCNLILNGIGTGIKTGEILILGEPTGGGLYFRDINNQKMLLTIIPETSFEYANISILDNILFYRNQAGSNSFRIGDKQSGYCLLTDDGSIHCKKILFTENSPIMCGDLSCSKILDLGDLSVYGECHMSKGLSLRGNLEALGHIYCNNGVEPFSLAEKKKDIEKYNGKALEEIKNTDIYYYNYKEDEVNCKKRVGAIIGKNYNCSKEIIGTEGKGIDIYSMLSISYKAIQEQQEEIEELQQKDKQKNKVIQELIERIEGGQKWENT
ncbi:MAG: hypothetical protein HFJ34_04705 [Clostridia bacterium]|nr:hypothetical protein [Clostridia bacterium]